MAEIESESIQKKLKKAIVRIGILPALFLLVISIAGGVALDTVWRNYSREMMVGNHRAWSSTYARSLSTELEYRTRAIEQELLQMAMAMPRSSRDRVEPRGFIQNGRALYRQGSTNESETVVLGSAVTARGIQATATSQLFDQYAHVILDGDPTIDGVVYASFDGVIRRLPGNNFFQRLGSDDRWQSLRILLESSRATRREAVWLSVAELSTIRSASGMTVFTPIFKDDVIEAVVGCEIDASRMLTYSSQVENGFVTLFNPSGHMIASDSTGHAIIPYSPDPLSNHAWPGLARVGQRMQRMPEASGIVTVRDIEYSYAFTRVENTNWRVLVFISNEPSENAGVLWIRSLVGLVAFALIMLISFLMMRKWIFYQHRQLAHQAKSKIQSLTTSVQNIGIARKLPQIERTGVTEWDNLEEEVRVCSLRTSSSDPMLPIIKQRLQGILEGLGLAVAILDKEFNLHYMNTLMSLLHHEGRINQRADWIANDRDRRKAIEMAIATAKIQHVEVWEMEKGEPVTYQARYVPLITSKESARACAEVLKKVEVQEVERKPEPQPEPRPEPKVEQPPAPAATPKPAIEKEPLLRLSPDPVPKKDASQMAIPGPGYDIDPGALNAPKQGAGSSVKYDFSGFFDKKEELISLAEVGLRHKVVEMLTIRPFPMGAVLRDVLVDSEQHIGEKDVQVHLNNPEGNFALVSNIDGVHNILFGLVGFAVSEIEKGDVTIDVAVSTASIEIDIIYPGETIDQDYIRQLTELSLTEDDILYLANHLRYEKDADLGVYFKWANALGGHLNIAGSIDGGSLFHLYLPRELKA